MTSLTRTLGALVLTLDPLECVAVEYLGHEVGSVACPPASDHRLPVDTTHPVMAGMPDKAAVFVDGSPIFETQEGFKGTVLARYQESGSPLLSGYLIGGRVGICFHTSANARSRAGALSLRPTLSPTSA